MGSPIILCHLRYRFYCIRMYDNKIIYIYIIQFINTYEAADMLLLYSLFCNRRGWKHNILDKMIHIYMFLNILFSIHVTIYCEKESTFFIFFVYLLFLIRGYL